MRKPSSVSSNFDKELGEVSFVLPMPFLPPCSNIMRIIDCLLGTSQVPKNTREGEKCHGNKGRREEVAWQLSFWQASWVKEIKSIRVKELNRETLFSTRPSANLNHITQVTCVGLSAYASWCSAKITGINSYPTKKQSCKKTGERSLDHLQALYWRRTKQPLGFHYWNANNSPRGSQKESFWESTRDQTLNTAKMQNQEFLRYLPANTHRRTS